MKLQTANLMFDGGFFSFVRAANNKKNVLRLRKFFGEVINHFEFDFQSFTIMMAFSPNPKPNREQSFSTNYYLMQALYLIFAHL